MAEKKETATKVEAPNETPKEKMVKIRIPRARKDEGDLFVSVNERTWLIKRGIEVEVPECVAKVIALSEKAEEERFDYESSLGK